MFNTFNTISTYNDDDEDSWRFPWRAIGITIALLAAIVYGVICTRNALGQFDVQRRADYLALTGPVAETIEQHLADDPSGDQQFYTDILPQLFSAEDKLAAVRVWDSAGQLAGELTRLDSQTLRAGGGGTLPDLNFHRVAKSLVPTLHDDAWTDPIAQLQLVETEQDLFTKRLEALRDTHVSVSAREKLYMQQDNLLQMADELNGNLHSMDEEIKEMNAVLDLLTLEDSDAIAKAAKQSNAIQNALTGEVAAYRTKVSSMPVLPKDLLAAAPHSSSLWYRIWPTIKADRVLVPLFIPAENEQLVTPAGFLECLFYNRPADVLQVIGTRNISIVGGLVLLALLMLVLPRRKEDDMVDDE